MGYQVVRVKLRGGAYVGGLHVFNAEQLEWPDERPSIYPSDIIDIVLQDQDDQDSQK